MSGAKGVTVVQILRAAIRACLAIALTLGLLPVFIIARLTSRHFSRAVASLWASVIAPILGLRIIRKGKPIRGKGALIANHISWLDIIALAATSPSYFVAKAEVAKWPGVGLLAKLAGTEFIERKAARAKEQEGVLAKRIASGQLICFFPEGTSSDGAQVLPFKTSLFSIFYLDGSTARAQPVSLAYIAPKGEADRFYALDGDMDFLPHLIDVLARSVGGKVIIEFHPPVTAADFADRKALAAHCESAVKQSHGAAIIRR